MNFEEFQNQSRFYVVGALEPGEVDEFERERDGLRKRALRRRLFRSAKRVHRPDDRAHETQSKIWSQNVQPRFQTSAAV